MNWLGFGPGLAAAGAVTLAGVLYLLQRLRVRHQQRTVITTLFWKQAVEETHARVLVERFRHPLAYLLVLAIALATWFAAAGPRPSARGDQDLVLLLDGSAGMARAARFEVAIEALREAVADAPRDATTVLFCGAQVRALLLPGEDPLLLDARLEGLAPEAAPPSVERALWDLVRAGERERPLAVRVVGDAPVRAALLEGLPEDVAVARLPLDQDQAEPNAGVVTLGVAAATSGAWDRMDVRVGVLGDGTLSATLSATLDGTPLTGRQDGDGLLFEDLPAHGGLFVARLAGGDGLALDDAAELVLPERRHLRVVTGDTLPSPLRAVLAADPAVLLVAAGEPADLAVRRAGEAVGTDVGKGLPTLELVDRSTQAEAFLITSAGDDPELALVEAVLELGLDRIDATSIANASGATISAGARVGDTRGLAVWEELLGPGYDLVEGRTFPLLIGRTLRWLGGVEPFPARVAAGEALSLELRDLEPLGLAPVPPQVGRHVSTSGQVVAASLLSRSASATPDTSLAESPLEGAGGLDLVLLLIVAALALLLLDGFLFRTGRTP